MGDNLHLMKWNLFLKSMVLPIIELHCYSPKQMGKFSELIALLRTLYDLLLTKAVIGNMNWIRLFLLSYRNTPHRTTGKMPSFLLFSSVVRDKLPTVPATVDGSRHDDVVKRNRAQKEKIKTYADGKRRSKSTELKTGDDALVKHTGTNDKLTSYWAYDLFSVIKVNGQQSLLRGKEMERYLPETFQWLRNIRTLVIRMTIQILIVAVLQK